MIIAVNFPIQAIEKKKPEKIRASTGFEAVTSAKYRCDALPIELWSHTISMCCYSMSFHMDFKTGLFRRPTTTFFRLFFSKKNECVATHRYCRSIIDLLTRSTFTPFWIYQCGTHLKQYELFHLYFTSWIIAILL